MAFYGSTSIKRMLTDLKTYLTTQFGTKVDKVTGKQLSTEDYTSAEKTKLGSLANIKSIGSGLSLDSQTGELTNTGGGGGGGAVSSVNGKTGAVTLDATDVGALPANTSIPSKTSELTNDSNFVADSSYVHTDNNYDATAKSIVDGVTAALADKISKSQTAGLVKNDGTIDTTQYVSDVSGKAGIASLAPAFDSSLSYTLGQQVIYDNTLYACIYEHTGAWNASHFSSNTNLAGMEWSHFQGMLRAMVDKADLTDLAPAFDDTAAYIVGQRVSYNGNVYRFISAHTAGDWDSNEVVAVDLASELYYETWVGITTNWANLSAAEKAKYKFAVLTDDVNNAIVDSAPTSGSANLVQSGGVYTALAVKANDSDVVKLSGNQTAHGDKQFDKIKFLYDDSASEPPIASIKNGEIYADENGVIIKSRSSSGTDNTPFIHLDAKEIRIGASGSGFGGDGTILSVQTEINSTMGSTILSSDRGSIIMNLDDTSGLNTFKINAYKTGNSTTQYKVFEVDNNGSVTAEGTVTVNGSDYAERFPALEEIPMCRFVTLDGESVKLAHNCDDYILGISSENPSIVGDKDVDGIEVGLLGKLWVEHDGSAVVNGFVKSGDNGIATRAKNGYRVMAVNGNKCRVLVK